MAFERAFCSWVAGRIPFALLLRLSSASEQADIAMDVSKSASSTVGDERPLKPRPQANPGRRLRGPPEKLHSSQQTAWTNNGPGFSLFTLWPYF